jgi:hypothetical protein
VVAVVVLPTTTVATQLQLLLLGIHSCLLATTSLLYLPAAMSCCSAVVIVHVDLECDHTAAAARTVQQQREREK